MISPFLLLYLYMKTTEELLKEMYNNVLKSGMFFEFYPELLGEFEKDKKQFIDLTIDHIKWSLLNSNPETLLGYKEAKEFQNELEQWKLELKKPIGESLDWDFSFMGGIKED